MNPTSDGFWGAVLQRIGSACSPGQYDTWFAQTRLLPETLPHQLEVGCPNRYVQQALEQHHLDFVLRVAGEVAGHRVVARFHVVPELEREAVVAPVVVSVVASEVETAPMPVILPNTRPSAGGHTPPPAPHPSRARRRETSPRIAVSFADSAPSHSPGVKAPPYAAPVVRRETDAWDSVPLNMHYMLDRFVVGPANRLPYAAAQAVSESPGHAYNPLFLYGSVGLGKSHLLQGIAHRVAERHPELRLLYISCETFVTHYVRAMERKDLQVFRELYRELDVLIIDDIHFLANKSGTQEEFFHTFNALYNEQKQIVISSDSPPEQIPELEQRLVSRFKMGLAAVIESPSFEMRVALFRQKANERGLQLLDEVVTFLAEHITNNVREIEGAIKLLDAHVELLGRTLTLRDVQMALADSLRDRGASPGTPITMDRIIAVVNEHFNTKLADLQSKKRTKSITLPRQICMYLAKRHTPHTLEEIGGYFGGRDHSTVIHAVDKITRLVTDDAITATLTARLEARLIGSSSN